MTTQAVRPLTTAPDFTVFERLESEVRYYCRKFPVVFERACGAELVAADGRTYVDFFCGAGTLSYGHNHPQLKQRLLEYVEADGLTHGLDTYTTAKQDFLTSLQEIVLGPRGLDYKMQFSGPTGTDAVEVALKLARKATGRRGIVAFAGAYHGMSRGSLEVTGGRRARAAGGIGASEVVFIPYEDGPAGGFDSIGYLERMLTDSSSGMALPAAVIVEPLQMEGGVYPASRSWMQWLRELTERHGILLICDEIQVGCGRTGSFFCFEQAGVLPDIVTVSKALSGYGLPLAMTLFRRELDVWEPGEHTGTFRGNQLAFVTGAAALRLWQQPEFHDGRAAAGRRLEGFGEGIRMAQPDLRVRGRGMVLGIDMGRGGGMARAEGIQSRCFDNGLIVELCGRDDEVVKVMPPLTIDAQQLDRGLDILQEAITTTA
jgi:diaminobutyrate-2-oxoglutarate transaminase